MMNPDSIRHPLPLSNAATVHFVGIGGIGMSALAELLVARGHTVTGSDVRASKLTERLHSLGVRVNIGHTAEAVHGADLVVATSAARPDNPELVEARRTGLPVIKRAELLGWLMGESYGLAVAGTHGKTTTTGLLAFILRSAGLEPTALIGGEPLDFPSHGLLGKGRHLVAEADEFDRSFLRLWPKVAVITSIEADHLDCYANLEEIVTAFREFASRVPDDGLLVTCADDPILRQLDVAVPRQSYGFAADAGWRITGSRPVSPYGTRFEFTTPAGDVHECNLHLSGRHFAQDALAAIVAASHVGVEPGIGARALAGFRGTRRRFELVGEESGVVVVDDYGHHPTEVKATLRAARERHNGAIWCVFQPHTVNRTEKLLAEFGAAFGDVDHLLVLPIYQPAGREPETQTVTSLDLVELVRHPDARYVDGLDEAARLLAMETARGDLVITMGAGDVNRVGPDLLARLKQPAGDGQDPWRGARNNR
jgi:UDP-N-acetylmuramate--alanine ligase